MQVKEQTVVAPVAYASLAFIAIFVVSMAIIPLAVAHITPWPVSSGSGYPIEIIRAHTVYKTVDPATPTVVGLGVKGNR